MIMSNLDLRNTSLLTDIHSHVLPEMDDGSKSVEESLKMLVLSRECGVGRIIATPHFYPYEDTPEHFRERRIKSVAKLSAAAKEARARGALLPNVCVGAEVAYFGGFSRSLALDYLCIDGTDLILIEMPFEPWSNTAVEELLGLKTARGITPIVAHIDRYFRFFDKKTFEALAEGDVLLQANLSSFKRFGMRRRMLSLLEDGNVTFLGSDCHNMVDRSPDVRSEIALIEKKLGADTVDEINRLADVAFKDAKLIF